MRLVRLLAVGLAAVLATGAVTATSPPASAAPGTDPTAANEAARDDEHSPLMRAEQAQQARRAAGRKAPASAEAEVLGIDISRHQHPNGAPIDWAQVAGAGYRSVGIKASEGDYYLNDEHYADDRAGADAAGMYTYAYHFAIPNVSTPAAQAAYFLDLADYTQDGRTLPPALDVEWNPYSGSDGTDSCYGLTQAQMVAWIRAFLDEVKRRTGVDAIIYTSAGWWSLCTGNSDAFRANPLWVASWADAPTVPTGWTDWTIWQYSDRGSVPGISAPTDLNQINGGEATLDALAVEAPDPTGYTATDPVRVLDTRSAVGVGTTTPLGSGGQVVLDLSGRVPPTAAAAVLNVTGITTSSTYVTVWPNGSARPAVSNLNLAADEIRPNLVTVQLGPDRKVRLYNHWGATHLLADLAGWYATDATRGFTARSPQRVLDTRAGGGTPLGSATTRTLSLASHVPANATAVTLNLTGVAATRGTYVSVWPTGQPRPGVSNLNLADADPTPNLVTVKLGADRSVDLFNKSGSVHLLADLAGYYAPDTGSRFVAMPPRRLLDTRAGGISWVPATGGGRATTLDTFGPTGVTGTVLNLTGVSPSTGTYVTVYPKTSATPVRPGSSNLNLVTSQTTSNLVVTAVGANSEVWLFNNAGTVHLIADLAGYFVR